MTRLSDIQARLEEATPGPWQECGHERGGCCGNVWSLPVDAPVAKAFLEDEDAGIRTTPEHMKANARFIAHAPTDIRLLLDIAEAAQEVRENSKQTTTIENEWSHGPVIYCDPGAYFRLADALDALDAEDKP